jgi:hypothetical protein
MATATAARPAATRPAATTPAATQHTAGEKAIAAVVVGVAGAATVGVFAWAVWVASQISMPV